VQPKPPVDENALTWLPGHHPLDQMQIWFAGEPYEWQRRIIGESAKMNSRIICALCNEAGKTSEVIPSIGLAYMSAWPGCQVLSTAGVERQVKEQLFRYLNHKLRPYPKWSVSIDGMRVRAPECDGLQSTWVGYVPRDAITAEGFHRGWQKNSRGEWSYCPVVFIIDEAKAASPEMFEAVERINPDTWIVLSTPGPLDGAYYENFDQDSFDLYGNDTKDEWSFRLQVPYTQCPHLMSDLNVERVQRLIEKHGINSPFIQSMFLGRFASPADLYVFADFMDDVRHAMSGLVVPIPGKRRSGIDFSGGGDEQCIAIYQGTTEIAWQQFRERDTDILAGHFVRLLKQYQVKPEDVVADNGGLGQAVIDNMAGKGYRGIYRYMNNAPARNTAEYANKTSEDHMEFRLLLKSRCVQLPKDNILMQQMRERKFGLDENNRIKLEEKKALRKRGKSPDRLETIVMAFSDYAPQHEYKPTGPATRNLATEGMHFDVNELEMAGQTDMAEEMWHER